MGAIRRIGISAALIGSGALGGTFWLYLKPQAAPLINEHASIWADQWELYQWSIPLACGLAMLAGVLYLVFGGAQEEKAAQEQRRRRVR